MEKNNGVGILTNISLFSGAGGLDLGAKLVGGFRTVCYVEYDIRAQGTIMSRMRDGGLDKARIWDDVSTFDGKPWRGTDIISGGFPCQDVSVAGKQAGISDGHRSGLWKEYARIIREVGPRFVLVENVTGLLGWGGAGIVLGDLAELGYDAFWEVLSAGQIGAPHERERVWMVAYPNGVRCVCLDENEKDIRSRINRQNIAKWVNAPHDILLSMDGVISTPCPGVLRVDDGMAEELDGIRQCGNGVCPQTSSIAWQKIKTLQETK